MLKPMPFIAVLLALAVSVGTLSAQPDSKNIYVAARAGVYTPLTDLFGYSYDEYRGAQRDRRKGAYLSLGLRAEMSLAPRALSILANVEYVPKIDVMTALCSPGGVCLFEETDDIEARMLVVTADLVIRPVTLNPGVTPYLLTGFGVKHYSGGLRDTGPVLHLGLGAQLAVIENFGLTLEVGDYLSWFNGFDVGAGSQTQHDLTATVGVRYGWL